MPVFEFLLAPGMAPFTGAFALVAGLVVIELAMLVIGASLIGDTDVDADADLDPGLDTDSGLDVADGADADLNGADMHTADLDGDPGLNGADGEMHVAAAPSGIAGWLGFGSVPFILWLAGVLTAFGLPAMSRRQWFRGSSAR